MKIETDASFYDSPDECYQRSSAIKSYEACSWLYYCNYVLKIPQADNRGALMGNVCHSFFECLLHTRHKHHHKSIIQRGSVKASISTELLVKKLIKKNNLPSTPDVFDKIDAMILVGLKTDFYVKGAKIVGNEYRFKIKNQDPPYSIYGTIDKIALTDDEVIIDDFKSSKQKYSGEDKDSGTQAMMYSLAAKKIWPGKKVKVRFIFLQFPDEPHQIIEFSDSTLAGFEHYLSVTQKKFDNFDIEDAYVNFAADQQIPEDDSFGGKLYCGFAKKPGQLKKDGTLMWHCPYRFPFLYYALSDVDGRVLKTSLKDDLKPKEGQKVLQLQYAGCPKHRPPIDTF